MGKLQILFGASVGVATILGMFGVVEYPYYTQIPFVILFFGVWLFSGGIHAKGMMERGDIDSFLLWVYAPLIVVVVLIDVIFNCTVGFIEFKEPPHEFLFTNRVKRHIKNKTKSGPAIKWKNRLNWIDPGHV